MFCYDNSTVVSLARFTACLRNPWKCLNLELKLQGTWKCLKTDKVLESTWKVLEFKSCKFWNFAFVDNFEASTCMHITSVTLQSKFWMSASRIWLFVDNFGAWKMQFGSLKVPESPWKVLEFCALSLLLKATQPRNTCAVGWSGHHSV